MGDIMFAEKNINNSEIKDFVDEYYTADRQRIFQKMLKREREITIHERLVGQSKERLYRKAYKIETRLEHGIADFEEVERLEYEFTHYLAAIEELEMAISSKNV